MLDWLTAKEVIRFQSQVNSLMLFYKFYLVEFI